MVPYTLLQPAQNIFKAHAQTTARTGPSLGLASFQPIISPTAIAARQQQIATLAKTKIQSYLDILTGGNWKGTYEDSVYDAPSHGGLWDYGMPAEDISIKFSRRGVNDATFVADRVIKYNNQDYPEQFVGSVSPDGRVVMNSLKDTDILMGQIDAKSGTLSLLFFDDGSSASSLGSQTAVGTTVFNDISRLYPALPIW